MRAFFPHIMASTPYIMLVTKNQSAMESVATFLARQCEGKTTRTKHAVMKATGGNSGCMTRSMVSTEKRRRIKG
jgi:hypothetical protein